MTRNYSLSLRRAGWKDESLVKHCSGCSTRFTILVTRKHHCRECGDVFCNACSSYKIAVQGVLKRCCTTCYRRAVVESNQAMTGNHINMDYDYPVSVGESSFSSNRSASFAKAAHLVESLRESPSSGKKNTSGRSAVGTQSSTLTEMSRARREENGRFPPWVDAFIYVAQEAEETALMKGDVDQVSRRVELYPPRSLPSHVVQDIATSAIPDEDACRAASAAGFSSDAMVAEEDDEGGDAYGHGRGDDIPRVALNYTVRAHDKSMGGLVGIAEQDITKKFDRSDRS